MKSHPILGKLAIQNRPYRAAHPRMAIGESAVKLCRTGFPITADPFPTVLLRLSEPFSTIF